MKKRTRQRLGALLFFIPVVAILALFVTGNALNSQQSTGTLIIEAQSTYANDSRFINVLATVNGVTHMTPYNTTITPGTYTITYSSLKWYYPPESRTVSVPGGTRTWAVGTFKPIPSVVSVTQTGFNETTLKAGSGITPVVWVNQSSQPLEIESSTFTHVIPAESSFFHVFRASGNYTIFLAGTSATMTAVVS